MELQSEAPLSIHTKLPTQPEHVHSILMGSVGRELSQWKEPSVRHEQEICTTQVSAAVTSHYRHYAIALMMALATGHDDDEKHWDENWPRPWPPRAIRNNSTTSCPTPNECANSVLVHMQGAVHFSAFL